MIDKTEWEKMAAEQGPGKFEGESAATFYYYDAMMNGDGEILQRGESEVYTCFEISEEESEAFSIDKKSFPIFVIYEANDGHVYGREITQYEYDAAVHEAELFSEEEN